MGRGEEVSMPITMSIETGQALALDQILFTHFSITARELFGSSISRLYL